MCFWEAQMPWRSPCNNNRDCSQLWMVLVDFSSNKNHESFHNFWNCKEITTLWLWEGEKDTLWSTKSSKLKCVPFFCLLRSCTSSIQLAMEKKYLGTLRTTCIVASVEFMTDTVQPSVPIFLGALGQKCYFMCAPTFYGSKGRRRRYIQWGIEQTWGLYHRSCHRYTHVCTPFCRTTFSVNCSVLLISGVKMKFSKDEATQCQLLPSWQPLRHLEFNQGWRSTGWELVFFFSSCSRKVYPSLKATEATCQRLR